MLAVGFIAAMPMNMGIIWMKAVRPLRGMEWVLRSLEPCQQ